MPQRLDAQGPDCSEWTKSLSPYTWDDGSDHDDVSMIYVRGASEGIESLVFNYIKNGQRIRGSFRGMGLPSFTQTFEINHLKDEQLLSIEGYYRDPFIRGIQFKTNLRVSELIGNVEDCSKFSLAVDGKKIIGFHGSSYKQINSLGAYFTWISPTRLDAKGDYGGNVWDDGADHEGISKIYIRGGPECIRNIKFDYVKDGQQIHGQPHGGTGRGFTEIFELNHLENEYLVSVEGYYDDSKPGVIQGIQFESNIKTSELVGYDTGKKFRLASNGKKIIGFHGYADLLNLNSLGAYFTTSPIIKLESKGGTVGDDFWDDGTFDDVRKVYVFYSITAFCPGGPEYGSFYRLMLNDDNPGKLPREGQKGEFEVDYPNEFITCVEGTLYPSVDTTQTWVSSLTFKTSKGRTSPTFGAETNIKFVLQSKGCALVGFHGRTTNIIKSLGAYCRPLPPVSDTERLEARGGDGGASWDDGVSDGIRYVHIGYGELGVTFVKFMFRRDDRLVVGDHHGGKTVIEAEEFKLDYPGEYLISVEGSYDVVDDGYYKSESEVIVMLRFKTNKRTSPTFGIEVGTSFALQKKNHKIVGFHGKASTTLHQIGVHVLPIT